MNNVAILCPRCRHEFQLAESVAEPLLSAARAEFEVRLAAQAEEIAGREAELAASRQRLAHEAAQFEIELERRVAAERGRVAEEETARARLLVAVDLQSRERELAGLRELMADREAKLAEAQAAQAQVVRRTRELEDSKRELDLTIERRVNELAGPIREQSKRDAEEDLLLRIRERDQQISSLQGQIDDLKHRAHLGSQQLQGEAQEVELEALLRSKFPLDDVAPVPK